MDLNLENQQANSCPKSIFILSEIAWRQDLITHLSLQEECPSDVFSGVDPTHLQMAHLFC